MIRSRGNIFKINICQLFLKLENLFPCLQREVYFQHNTSVPFLKTSETNLDGVFVFWKMSLSFSFRTVFILFKVRGGKKKSMNLFTVIVGSNESNFKDLIFKMF